jgi:hypothetical protein
MRVWGVILAGGRQPGGMASTGNTKITWGRQVRENPLHLTPYDKQKYK